LDLVPGGVQVGGAAVLELLDGLGDQVAEGLLGEELSLDVLTEQGIEVHHPRGEARAALPVSRAVSAGVVPDPVPAAVAAASQGDRATADAAAQDRAEQAVAASIAAGVGPGIPVAGSAGDLDGVEDLTAHDGREAVLDLLLFDDLPAVAVPRRQDGRARVDRVLQDVGDVLRPPQARPSRLDVLA